MEQDLRRRLALPRKPTARHWLMAAVLAFPLALAPMTLLAPQGPYSPWILLAAAMTVLIAERDGTNYRGPLAAAVGAAVVLIAAYAVQKAGVGLWVPAQPASAGLPGDAFVALLVEKGLMLTTAESCTGGMIAQKLTDVAGSSAYVLGGVPERLGDLDRAEGGPGHHEGEDERAEDPDGPHDTPRTVGSTGPARGNGRPIRGAE